MNLSFFAGIWLIGNALSMSGIGELWVKNRRWVDKIPKSPDPKTPMFVFHGISNGEIVKDHIKTSKNTTGSVDDVDVQISSQPCFFLWIFQRKRYRF